MGFDMEQRLAVLQPHLFEGVPLPAVAQQAGVPLRTARRWLAAYRTDGADGLTRVVRADRNTRRIPAQVVEVVEGYWDREWGFATRQPSLVQRGALRPG